MQSTFYNLIICCKLRSLLLMIFSTVVIPALGQDSNYLKLRVTSDMATYQQQVSRHPGKRMVELSNAIPFLKYDLRYAGTNNFMQRRMYPEGTKVSYMRDSAVSALRKAAAVFRKDGYGIKVFDAYRPYAVTVLFWDLVKDERYVANPAKGSGHNRGTAIDLTLYDLKTGKEVEMGTGFDNFSDTAHHSFTMLPKPISGNRKYLRTIMESAGFKALETEWWHYFLPTAEQYEVLNIPFNKLAQASKQPARQ
jgi:D-alanyl-D-alanine dipeptidase